MAQVTGERAFEALIAGHLEQDVIDRDARYSFGRQGRRVARWRPLWCIIRLTF